MKKNKEKSKVRVSPNDGDYREPGEWYLCCFGRCPKP